jgi:hypothetical protein
MYYTKTLDFLVFLVAKRFRDAFLPMFNLISTCHHMYNNYLINTIISIFLSGLGLGCLTPLSTIFQLYRCGQFYWWREKKYPEKTTDRPVVSHVTNYITQYCRIHFAFSGIRTHNISGDRYLLHKCSCTLLFIFVVIYVCCSVCKMCCPLPMRSFR